MVIVCHYMSIYRYSQRLLQAAGDKGMLGPSGSKSSSSSGSGFSDWIAISYQLSGHSGYFPSLSYWTFCNSFVCFELLFPKLLKTPWLHVLMLLVALRTSGGAGDCLQYLDLRIATGTFFQQNMYNIPNIE